jgi:hypothetical protein
MGMESRLEAAPGVREHDRDPVRRLRTHIGVTGTDSAGGVETDAGADGRPAKAGLLLGRRPRAAAEPTLWRTTVQWVVAALVTVLLALLTYSLDGWIPILSHFDLGVHEFGHLLTFWAPPLLCSLAGSSLQIAAPLGLAAHFWWRRDDFAVILMLALAAENLHNVSVYTGDAEVMDPAPLRRRRLRRRSRLAQHPGADGPAGRDRPDRHRRDAISAILFIVAFGLAALGFVRSRREPADR